MIIMVTGAAGYIGSIVADALVKEGHTVVGVDDLSQGHKKAVNPRVHFYQMDIGTKSGFAHLFKDYKFDAVCHLAAKTVVSRSMTNPAEYFHVNTISGLNILDLMRENGVNRMIFSSSAAVYGNRLGMPYLESNEKCPCNSYGETKLIFENILNWYYKAYGIKYIAFRYFNVAGATESLGEDHRPETHIIPNIIKATMAGKSVTIYGDKRQTIDGTCMRDYVHVSDVARAHILALDKIDDLKAQIFNLGSIQATVKEVINCAQDVIPYQIDSVCEGNRPGDPDILVSDHERARVLLEWQPKYTYLEDIIETAWKWAKVNPEGYKE